MRTDSAWPEKRRKIRSDRPKASGPGSAGWRAGGGPFRGVFRANRRRATRKKSLFREKTLFPAADLPHRGLRLAIPDDAAKDQRVNERRYRSAMALRPLASRKRVPVAVKWVCVISGLASAAQFSPFQRNQPSFS